MSFAELACIAPLALALHSAALAQVAPGTSVAILGAGGMGLLWLLAARHAVAGTIVVIVPLAGRAARERTRRHCCV